MKRVPSAKFITLVGTSAKRAQARRVVSRSSSRRPGFFFSAVSEWRFMKGKSKAHHTSPITGTQISCCLRKNLRKGMRRLKIRCSTKMSTQERWLQFTRYQPPGRRPSRPCTSQAEAELAAIQTPLHEIQFVAMALAM